MLSLWATILRNVNGSHLLLKDRALGDKHTRDDIRRRFATLGVDPQRLMLEGHSSMAEYLATHHRVDILLDVFPFNGHTTSLHAMWMGVPMVTLAGHTHVSRRGVSLLKNLDLAELIADSPAAYVQIATRLAADPARLKSLRETMRQRLLDSPICDETAFVKALEETYRRMWRAWCAGTKLEE